MYQFKRLLNGGVAILMCLSTMPLAVFSATPNTANNSIATDSFTETSKYNEFYENEKTAYTVTFNMNGVGKQVPVQTVLDGGTIEQPDDPSKAAYIFKGWYTEKEGGAEYDFSEPVHSDITLYAHWGFDTAWINLLVGMRREYNKTDKYQSDTYTVSFEANGAARIASQIVKNGECVTYPTEPTRDGYVFVGWYTDNIESNFENHYNFSAPVETDFTLFAKWIDVTDTTDTDEDGLPDSIEAFYGTDKTKIDTDMDELSDYIEIAILNLNPLMPDSDNNGIIDGEEDSDDDEITNKDEVVNGTDPSSKDTDMDDLYDNDEIRYNTNPVLFDTDGDGVSDGKEIELSTNPLVAQESFIINKKRSDTVSDTYAVELNIELPGDLVETLNIEPVANDSFFTESMPGYIGQAYDFSVGGEFESAELRFAFDSEYLADPEFDPVIYYFNEKDQTLEEIPTSVSGNIASATVTHFSKYILIDRSVYQEAFEWIDVWDSTKNYTGVEIILVIDDSGSMYRGDRNNQRLTVAQNLVEKLPKNSKIGIVKFETNTTILTPTLTSDKDAAKAYLTTETFKSSGGTYMYTAINDAFELFEISDESIMKVMVVLTDGETGDTSYHSSTIDTANDSNTKIYTVGLGNSTRYFNNYLKPLAVNTGAAFYLASEADQLADIYDNIGQKIDIETDSDNDGIADYYEDNMIIFDGSQLMLDKYNPDTDGDGLLDGEEVELSYTYNADETKVKVIGKMKSKPSLPDSDGDGLIDSVDKNPLNWDVSDRDLAMFAALTYETPNKYNNKTIDDSYYFLSYASAEKEIYDYWDIVDCSGEKWADVATHFYATTYKNGNNIVIAYRGTDSELGEWVNNIVGVGLLNYHSEEGYAKQYAKKITKLYPNCNIYITGHSLGGYLAQFGASEIILNHDANNLKKVAYFNGIGLKYNKLLFFTKNDVLDSLERFYNENENDPNLISYNICGDVVSALGTHSGAIISYIATSDAIDQHRGKHGSGELTDFLSKSAAGWLTILSSENIAYYYNYYNCSSIVEYFWITHETDSFLYYLTAGTRPSKK